MVTAEAAGEADLGAAEILFRDARFGGGGDSAFFALSPFPNADFRQYGIPSRA